MRIAQIAPLMEAVPPKLYGGTERIVAYLTDELVAMGHEVSLFASGDSVTTAHLEAAYPQALRLDPTIRDHVAPLIAMLERVAQRAREFDVIHLHCDYLAYPVLARSGVPFLATLHGRLDLPELKLVYEAFADLPVVSIADSQREPLPGRGMSLRFITDCRSSCCSLGTGPVGIWRFSAAYRRKRRRIAPSASRPGPG